MVFLWIFSSSILGPQRGNRPTWRVAWLIPGLFRMLNELKVVSIRNPTSVNFIWPFIWLMSIYQGDFTLRIDTEQQLRQCPAIVVILDRQKFLTKIASKFTFPANDKTEKGTFCVRECSERLDEISQRQLPRLSCGFPWKSIILVV